MPSASHMTAAQATLPWSGRVPGSCCEADGGGDGVQGIHIHYTGSWYGSALPLVRTPTPFASVGCQRHGEPDGGGGGVEGGRGHEGGATAGTADVDARKLEEREQGCIDRQLRQQDSMTSECQRKMECETLSVSVSEG